MRVLKTTTALALVMGLSAALHGQSTPSVQSPVTPLGPTGLDVTPTGTPIINIAKPDQNGTSYNIYDKFNVGAEGVIFNNSKNVGQTVLGGQILANPNLKNSSGSANLILNEVLGGKRSDLYGPMEVFGSKAGLIIANQAGITCDGCGFINVARAGLSTGKITFGRDGAFTGFAVNGGDVNIKGKGLLAGNVDYFDIVTGLSQINASLYAKDLLIAGGSGDFDYASRTATQNGTQGLSGNDRLAIDSSLLGGMYANRIRLIGTSAGVGVNLQGTVTALTGALEITADGNIAVKNIVGAGDVSVKSNSGKIQIDERLYAGGSASFDAKGDIAQSGSFVGAGKDVVFQSGRDITLGGQGIYAGLSADGKLSQQGGVTINALGALNVSSGQLVATKDLNVTAGKAVLGTGTQASAANIAVVAVGALDVAGQLEAQGNVGLRGDVITLSGSATGNDTLSVTARSIAQSGNAIGLLGANYKALQALDINSGTASIQTNGNLTVSASTIANKGRLLGVAGAAITASDTIVHEGAIVSGGALSFNSGGNADIKGALSANGTQGIATLNIGGRADISGTVAAVKELKVVAGSVRIGGQLSTSGNLAVQSNAQLDLDAGSVVAADGTLNLDTDRDITAAGYLSSGKALEIKAFKAADLSGQTNAKGPVTIKGASVTAAGTVISEDNLTLEATGTAQIGGALSAKGVLTLGANVIETVSASQLVAQGDVEFKNAATITQSGRVSGANVALRATDSVTNSGNIYAAQNLTLAAANAVTQSGTAQAAGILELSAEQIVQSGAVLGVAGVNINGRGIELRAGSSMQAGSEETEGALQITASGNAVLAGTIVSTGDANVSAAGDLDQNARMELRKSAQLQSQGRFLQNGAINANGSLALLGYGISGSGALSSNAAVTIRSLAGTVDLTGDITAKASLLVSSPDLIVLSGNVVTDGILDLSADNVSLLGSVTALTGVKTDIRNTLAIGRIGALRTNAALILDAARFDNEGLLYTGGPLVLGISGDALTGVNGRIISSEDIQLRIGGRFDNRGLVQARTDLLLNVASVLNANTGSNILAGGLLDVQSGSLDLGGTIASDKFLRLNHDRINIAQSGVLFARKTVSGEGYLSVKASETISNAGKIVGLDSASVTASGALTQAGAGRIESEGVLSLTAKNIDLGGSVTGLSNVAVTADNLASISKSLSATGTLTIKGSDIVIGASANVVSGSTADITAINQARVDGALSATGKLSITAANIENNKSIIGSGIVALTAREALKQNGLLQSGSDLTLNVGSAILTGRTLSFGKTAIDVATIDFRIGGFLQSTGAMRVNASGDTILSGAIEAFDKADIASGANMVLSGTLVSDKSVSLNAADALQISGGLSSQGQLGLKGASANLSGKITTNAAINVQALSGDILLGGTLTARGNLLAAGDVTLTARDDVKITGLLNANNIVTLIGRDIVLGQGVYNADGVLLKGVIRGNDGVVLNAARLIDTGLGSQMLSNNAIALSSVDINTAGTIQTETKITLGASGNAVFGGKVDAGSDLAINSNALTITGSLQSGNKQAGSKNTVTALSTLTLGTGSEILSAGTLTLNAGGKIDNAGVVASAGALSVKTDGDIRAGGKIQSDDALTVSGNAIAITGAVAADRVLTVTALGNLTVSGKLTGLETGVIKANSILIDSLPSAVVGILYTKNGLSLESANGITNRGFLGTDAALLLNYNGAFNNSGSLSSGGNFAINTASDLTLGGNVFAGGDITLNARDLTVNATIVGKRGLTAGGRIVTIGLGADVQSGGDLVLDASDALTISGGILAKGNAALGQGNTTLRAVNGITLNTNSSVEAANSLTLNSTQGSVTTAVLSALESAGSIKINAASADLGGELRGGTATQITTTSDLNTSNLISSGNIALTAANAVLGGRFISGDFINVRSAQTVVNGQWDAAGKIDFGAPLGRALDLTFAATSDIKTNTDVMIAGDKIALLGNLIANGIIDARASSQLTTANNIKGLSAVTLQSGGALNSNAAISASGALSITGSATNLNGVIRTGDTLTIIAGDLAVAGTLSASKTLDIDAVSLTTTASSLFITDADLKIDVDNAATLGALSSKTGFNVIARGALTLSGDAETAADNAILQGNSILIEAGAGLYGTKKVAVTADQELRVLGELSAVSTLSSVAGSIAILGKVMSDDAITFKSLGGFSNTGTITTLNAIEIKRAGDFTHSGTIKAGTNFNLGVGGNNAISGLIDANDGLTIKGNTSIISSILNSLKNVTINGSDVTFEASANVASGQALSIEATGNLTTAGTIDAAGDAVLSAGGAFTQNANLVGRSDVTLNAIGALNVTQATQAAGDMVLSGASVTTAFVGTAIAPQGTLLSDGNMSVTSSTGDIVLGGLTSGANSLNIKSARDITLNVAARSRGDLTLDGRDIAINAALTNQAGTALLGKITPITSLTASGAVTVAASGGIATDGTLLLTSSELANAGEIFAQDDASFTISGALGIAGAGNIATQKALKIDAGSLNISSNDPNFDALGSGGATTINIAGSAVFDGNAYAAKGFSLVAGSLAVGGKIEAEEIIGLESLGALTLRASSYLTSDQNIIAKAATSLDANGKIFSANVLASPQGLSLIAGSNSLLATGAFADIQSRGAIALSGNALSFGGKITSDKTITAIGGSGALNISGVLNAVQDITMSGGATVFDIGSGIISSGKLTLTTASLDSAANIDAATGVSITSTLSDIITRKNIFSTQDIRLNSARDFTQFGKIETNGILDIRGTAITLNGSGLGNAITVTSKNSGNIAIGANTNWDSETALTLTSTGDIFNAGALFANGNFIANADRNLTQNGTVLGGGDVTLKALGNFTNSNRIDATGSNSVLSVSGRNFNNSSFIVSDGTVSLKNDAGLGNLAGVISAKTRLDLTSAGDTTISGTLITDGILDAQITGTLSTAATGQLRTRNGALTVTADAFNNAGITSAGTALTINAPVLTNTGTLESSDALTLAILSGTLGGNIASQSDVAINSSAGALRLTGSVTGSSITLGATGGDLTLGAGSLISSTTSAALTSTANIIANGQIGANAEGITVTASTGAVTIGGAARLSSLGAVTVTARDAIGNFGSGYNNAGKALGIDTAGSVTLTGGSIITGQILSNAAVTLNAAGAIAVTSEVNAVNNASLTSSAGAITVDAAGAVRSREGIATLSANQALTNAGAIIAANGIGLTSGTRITNIGTVYSANGTLGLKAPMLDLGGAVIAKLGALNFDTNAVTITGQVSSDKALTFNNNAASLSIASGGLLQTNEAITLTLASADIGGTLKASGASGAMAINAGTVSVQQSGVIEAGSTLRLNSIGTVANNGIIASAGALTLSGTTLTLNGLVSSQEGAVAITGTGDVTVSKRIEASNGLSLTGANVTVESGGILSSFDTVGVPTSGALSVNTAGVLINQGQIAGAKLVTLTGNTKINSTGSIYGGTGAVLTTGGLANVGVTTAGGNITVTAGRVTTTGEVNAGSNVAITASIGDIDVGGNIIAGTASSTVNLIATGGAIRIAAAKEIYGTQSVALTGAMISNAGNISSDGRNALGVFVPGSVTLNARDQIEHSGTIVTAGNVNLQTQGTAGAVSPRKVDITGRIDGGNITITSPNLTIASVVRAAGGVTLNADTAANISGDVIADGAAVFNGAANGAAQLTITNTGQLTSLTSNVLIDKVSAVQINGLISAKTAVDVNYTGILNIGATGRVEALSYNAFGAINGGDVMFTRTGIAGLSGAGYDLNIAGDVAGGRNVTFTGGAMNIGGYVYAGQDLSISSDNYTNITANGFARPVSLQLGANATLFSGRNTEILVLGALEIANGGYISADGNAAITARNFVIGGDVFAGGTLAFNRRGDLAGVAPLYDPSANFVLSGSAASVGNLTITTGGKDIDLKAGSTLISNGQINANDAGAITARGAVSAGDLISFAGTGDIALAGSLKSGRKISVLSGGALDIAAGTRLEILGNAQTIANDRNQGALANIELQANGALTNAGTIYADGSIALKSANGSISNFGTGNITALGGVVLQADTAATSNLGVIKGGALAIFQGLNFNNTGDTIASGDLLISAPNITNTGLLGAGNNLALTTPGTLINSGTLFAAGNLDITAGIKFHNDTGTALALGNITITTPEFINDSARVESLGGNVTINSANVINRIKNLVITPGISQQAGVYSSQGQYFGGYSTAGYVGYSNINIGPTQPDGSFQITITPPRTAAFPAGIYYFRPSVYTDDVVTPNDGASQIVAANNITINGGTTGTVLNSNSSILAGSNIAITTGTLNNLATLIRTTRIEYLPTGGIISFSEDGYVSCSQVTATSGSNLVPGSCSVNGIYTYWQEYEYASQTITSDVPLPSIIRAGGTVTIAAARVGNGIEQQNTAVTGGSNPNPSTTLNGASAQGGIGTYSQTGEADAVQQASGIAVNTAGAQNGPGSGNFAAGYTQGNAAAQGNGSAGNGAGNIAGVSAVSIASNAALTAENSGNVRDAVVAAAATAIGNSADGSVTAGNTGYISEQVSAVSINTTAAGGAAQVNPDGSNTVTATRAVVGPQASVAIGNLINPTDGIGATRGVVDQTRGISAVQKNTGDIIPVMRVLKKDGDAPADVIGGATAPATQLVGALNAANGAPIGAANALDTSASLNAATASITDGYNGIAINGVIGSDGKAGTFIFDFLRQFKLINSGGGFGIANGSLFDYNDNPDAKYLFTTKRGFGSAGELYDSDYFFDQLDVDKNTRFTRLGDGFFEAQLISQQVRTATGQAQLDRFGNGLDQAQGLMQAAVDQQKSLNLKMGVALSSDQLKNLTGSLVWWVSAEVSGRNVLVPVVYLAANDKKSIQNGALIAGTNVVMNVAGNISNTGVINASRVVSLTSGGDILNAQGGRISGSTVIATAARDIINSGGSTVDGGNILLRAGRDVSLTGTPGAAGAQPAINATGNVRLEAGRDVALTSSAISAGGSAALVAGRDVSLSGGVTNTGGANRYVGSNVQTGGNLVIDAGRTASITGSDLTAGGSVGITGVQGVSITSGVATNTDTATTSYRNSKKNYGTSTTTTTSTTNQLSNISAGQNVVINSSQGAVAIKGGDIAAGGSVGITGATGVDISAVADTSVANTTESSRKGKTRTNGTTTVTDTTNVLAGISAGENVVIKSDGAVKLTGANIDAGGSVGISGQSVSIAGVIDTQTVDSNSVTTKKGFLSKKITTVIGSSTDQTAVLSSISAGDDVRINSKSTVDITGVKIASGDETSVAAVGNITIGSIVEQDSASQTTSVQKKNSLLGIVNGAVIGAVTGGGALAGGIVGGASGGKSTSNKTETSTSTTNVLSDIAAGGNLTVLSTAGDVKIAGATLDSAAGNTLIVGTDVTITGVVDSSTYSMDSTAKKSGFLSSTKTVTSADQTTQDVVKSSVTGSTVTIAARNNLNVLGSDVAADGKVMVTAGNDITIGTVQTTNTSSDSSSVKKSGLALTGNGLFVGVSKNAATNTQTSVTNTGSTIGSLNGDVTIDAGGNTRITGSQVIAPGKVIIAGKTVTIENAMDQVDTTQGSKSSSIGVTVSVQSPLIDAVRAVQTVGNMGKTAVTSGNDRTQAIAAVGSAAAAVNSYDAAKKVLEGGPASVTVQAGFSNSRSTGASTDQTVVGSVIKGGDLQLIARGASGQGAGTPSSGTINITGSQVAAGRDLALAATGPITVSAATETDTSSSTNRSSSGSLGATFGGTGGVTITGSGQASRGNSSGTDVTNIESALQAGRNATITTPGALTLNGSTLTGERVDVTAGALNITSVQDTSTFSQRQTTVGGSLSVSVATGQVSGSANYGRERQNGSFASVGQGAETQAGIQAGSGGYTIDVRGATNLTGGVIGSTASPANNTLTTGTLTTRDIQNRETYSAASLNLSGGFGFGTGRDAGGTATADPATRTQGSPGVNLGNGVSVTGGLPSAMGANGGQSGTTGSAIAPGTIIIRPGEGGVADAASLAVANTVSRDTATANDGALTQEFDAARRAEIQEAFAVTRETANQTSIFFANRAAEEAKLRDDADKAKAAGDTATYDRLTLQADGMRTTYGSGSPLRILSTAFNAAASGGNAAGGLGSLAQGAVVGVIQSLAVTQVKHIADRLMTETRNADGTVTYTQNAASEGLRAALQAIVACGGASAAGANCGGAALGASTSVALGALINQATGNDSTTVNASGFITNPRSLEEQQAVTQLIATLAGAVAAATGVDAPAAVVAATIEVENNRFGESYDCDSSIRDCYTVDEALEKNTPYITAGIITEKMIRACFAEEKACDEGRDILRGWFENKGVPFGPQLAGLSDEKLIASFRNYELYQNQSRAAYGQTSYEELGKYLTDPSLIKGLDGNTQRRIVLAINYVQDNPGSTSVSAFVRSLIGPIAGVSDFAGATLMVNQQWQLATRLGGLVQAAGGVLEMGGGVTAVAVGGTACAPTAGGGCLLAAGGVVVTLMGADNVGTGLANLIHPSGNYNTAGATLCSNVTGASVGTCEVGYAGVQIVTGAGVAVGTTRVVAGAADNVAGTAGTAIDDAGRQVGNEMGINSTTAGATANSATGSRLTDDLIATMERPVVSDARLSNLLDDLYKPNSTVGSGSTAAAVRQEIATGVKVGGRFHSQKAKDYIRALVIWVRRNPSARPSDIRAAENVIKDMRNALGGN